MKKNKSYTKICVFDDCNNLVSSSLISPSWNKSTIDKLVFSLALAYPICFSVRLL
nr:MAG TPA: hypothetical protein [Microviridae sp.]